MKRLFPLLVLAGVMGLFPKSLSATVIVLNNGDIVSGAIQAETKKAIELKTPFGRLKIAKQKIDELILNESSIRPSTFRHGGQTYHGRLIRERSGEKAYLLETGRVIRVKEKKSAAYRHSVSLYGEIGGLFYPRPPASAEPGKPVEWSEQNSWYPGGGASYHYKYLDGLEAGFGFGLRHIFWRQVTEVGSGRERYSANVWQSRALFSLRLAPLGLAGRAWPVFGDYLSRHFLIGLGAGGAFFGGGHQLEGGNPPRPVPEVQTGPFPLLEATALFRIPVTNKLGVLLTGGYSFNLLVPSPGAPPEVAPERGPGRRATFFRLGLNFRPD